MAAMARIIDSPLVFMLWWLYEVISEWGLIVEPVVEVAGSSGWPETRYTYLSSWRHYLFMLFIRLRIPFSEQWVKDSKNSLFPPSEAEEKPKFPDFIER